MCGRKTLGKRKTEGWYITPANVITSVADLKNDRHIQIAGAIALLVENAGLKPLRSHLGRRRGGPSACSIVAAALAQLGEHQSERNVEYIWAQYRQSPRIRHQGSEDYIKNRYHQQFNNLSETMD